MMRVVLDANQFVSSLLVKVGLPAQALDAWRAGAYQLIISPAILEEIEHTLGYTRIQRKLSLIHISTARCSSWRWLSSSVW